MLPVLVHKGRYFAELLQLRLAKPVAPLLLNFYQATIGQYLNMQGDSLARKIKFLRNSVHIVRPRSDQIDDRPACGVGYCLVNISSGFHNYASKCLQI